MGFINIDCSIDKDDYFFDCKDDFCWIPIKREEFKAGDTAYRKLKGMDEFNVAEFVYKILDSKYCIFISENFPYKTDITDGNWFKLVRKDEL